MRRVSSCGLIPLTLCHNHDLPGLHHLVFPAGRGPVCPVVARGPGTLTPAGTCCCSGRKDIPLQAPVAGLGEALAVSHTCWTSLLSEMQVLRHELRLKVVGAAVRHSYSQCLTVEKGLLNVILFFFEIGVELVNSSARNDYKCVDTYTYVLMVRYWALGKIVVKRKVLKEHT